MSLQAEANAPHRAAGKRAALWVLLLAPLLLMFGLALAELLVLPIEDDYDALLDFGLHWQGADWAHRLQLLLTTQHNEYKLLLQELMVGAQVSLTHHLALGPFVWGAYLLVLLCLWLLWRHCAVSQPMEQRLWLFVPVVWLFANLGYAEALDWAMGGMQQIAVIAFSLLAFSLLTRKDNGAPYLACAAAVLACFSSANGFAMMPLGLLLLWRRRAWGAAVLWMTVTAASLLIYFLHYQPVHHQKAVLLRAGLFLLAVIGSGLGYHGITVLAILLGLALLGCFAVATVSRCDRSDPVCYWACVWIVLSLALAAVSRSAAGMAPAVSSRYHVYSSLLLCLFYQMAVNGLARSGELRQWARIFPTVITLAVIFGLGSDALGLYLLHRRRADIAGGMESYARSGGVVSPMTYRGALVPERAGLRKYTLDVLNRAEQTGLYRLPDSFQAMCPRGSACDTGRR